MLPYSLFRQSADARVNDRLKFFSRLGIVENNRSKLCAVERAVRLQGIRAEARNDFLPSILVRLNDFSSKDVRVDDRRAQIFEDSCDGAFPRSNSSCQTD